jgi:hypothetical protein
MVLQEGGPALIATRLPRRSPEDPPAQSVPANNGRRSYDDHGIAPIEESGKQCEANPTRVIHASGLDATLDITRELLAKNQVLSADRSGRA